MKKFDKKLLDYFEKKALESQLIEYHDTQLMIVLLKHSRQSYFSKSGKARLKMNVTYSVEVHIPDEFGMERELERFNFSSKTIAQEKYHQLEIKYLKE